MSETKMYSVLDKWTDLEKENIVDFTSVDGVVTEARVNGVPAGGGGVVSRTITGTLANPFGQPDWFEISSGIFAGNKFAKIEIDFSVLAPGTVFKTALNTPSNSTIQGYFCNLDNSGVNSALGLNWQCSSDPSECYLYEAFAYMGQTMDLKPYAANIPTTLTLYEVG